jgi:hypothetical protein
VPDASLRYRHCCRQCCGSETIFFESGFVFHFRPEFWIWIRIRIFFWLVKSYGFSFGSDHKYSFFHNAINKKRHFHGILKHTF